MVSLVDVNNPKEVGRARLHLPQYQKRKDATLPVGATGKAPLSRDAADRVVQYYNTALTTYVTQFNIRPHMEARDRVYYREVDLTKAQRLAKSANMAGDTSKMQNITIPVVMPQVESALAYHTGVFLTGYPIFGVVAPPEQAAAIEQLETVIADNSNRYGWSQELMKALRDGLKYDLGAVEVIWEQTKSFKVTAPKVSALSSGSVEETEYQGNRIRHLNAYNIILDTRVSPDRNHIEGEFAGYTEVISPVAMKQRMDELSPLGTMNFTEAFNSPSTGAPASGNNQTAGYYTPQINPDALLPNTQQQPFSWDTFFNVATKSDVNYQSAYEWTVLYLRLIPSVFGIRGNNPNHVQIYKFIIVNRSTLIFAERQNNAHRYLPIIVCKPSNDGMLWQSKSFGQNAEPFQSVASALVNSALESQRRKVYDRIFYDPSRVNKSDIDNVSSVARIPIKNSQYNKDISSAIHISAYRDEGVSDVLAFSQNVTAMADMANGQNRVQQGQFQKGNKTKTEFNTVMSNSNSRQQMAAIALESSFFAPIKEIIKSNMLQYQPPTTLLNQKSGAAVDVDPVILRNSGFAFKISDGLLPSSKIASSDLFTSFLNAAMAIPALQAEYDIGAMVTYQMQLEGADWLDDFKRAPAAQQQYMATMQQASNASGQRKPPPAGAQSQQPQE